MPREHRRTEVEVLLTIHGIFIFQNRAQTATELLQELNSDVSGNFVEEVRLLYETHFKGHWGLVG